MDAASSADACDVCSGRETLADAKTTCSEHFLRWLDDPYQKPGATCAQCGWPASRVVPECLGHPQSMRYY